MNKLFLSNEAILIAVRDFLKNIYNIFRSKISFHKYHSLNNLSNVQIDHFGRIA